MNPEDLFADLPDEEQSLPVESTATSLFDDLPDERSPLEKTFRDTAGADPEEANRIAELSKRTGASPAEILADPNLKAELSRIPPNLRRLEQDAPITGAWLRSPDNYVAAKNDLEILRRLEMATKTAGPKIEAAEPPSWITRLVDRATGRNPAREIAMAPLELMAKEGGTTVDKMAGEVFAGTGAARQADRLGQAFKAGTVGIAGSVASALDWLSGSQVSREFADALDLRQTDIMPDDPGFLEKLASSAPSMLAFFIPGLGVGAGTAALGLTSARVAAWLGTSVMSASEALVEAGDVYLSARRKGFGDQEAGTAAAKTFWLNLPMLVVTNKLSFFTELGGTALRAVTGFNVEGFQEVLQGAISSGALGEEMTVWEYLETYAIGGVLGGGAGAVAARAQGAAERRARPRRTGPEIVRELDALAQTNLAQQNPDKLEVLFQEQIDQYNLPDEIYVEPEALERMEQEAIAREEDPLPLYEGLGLDPETARRDVSSGAGVYVPTSKVVRLVTDPRYEALKTYLLESEAGTDEDVVLEEEEDKVGAYLEGIATDIVFAGRSEEEGRAVAAVIGARAKIWAQETGRDPLEYLEQRGFQFQDESGLGEMAPESFEDHLTRMASEMEMGSRGRPTPDPLVGRVMRRGQEGGIDPDMARAEWGDAEYEELRKLRPHLFRKGGQAPSDWVNTLQGEGLFSETYEGFQPAEQLRLSLIDAKSAADRWAEFEERTRQEWEGKPTLYQKAKKAARDTARTLSQALKGGPRGSVEIDKAGRAVVTLTRSADASTAIHEVAHIFRRDLADLAAEEGVSDQVKADYQAILDWAKAGETWTEAQEEKFAKAFEVYLMEGRAPSPGLRSVFDRFRQWLMQVYRSIRGLNLRLNPQLREVFDRMLATSEEIEQARAAEAAVPALTEPPPGVTAKEWKAYNELARNAATAAAENVIRKRNQDLKALRREWTKEAKALFDANPIQQVITDIVNDGGLMLDEVAAEHGSAVVNSIRNNRKGLLRKDGSLPLDTVAAGLNSDPGAVVEMLARAPNQAEYVTAYRAAKEAAWIEEQDRIEAAITDEYLDLMRREAEMMFPGMGTIPTKTLKRQIKREVDGTTVADIGQRWVKEGDALRATYQKLARESRRIFAAGKKEGAARLKEKQREIAERRRARAQAKRELNKMLRYLKRIQRAKNIDPDYMEQISEMLSGYDLARRSQKTVEARQAMLDWYETQLEAGEEIFIPKRLLDAAQKKPISAMTLEEVRELHDTIQNIAHVGATKKRLLVSARKRNKDAAVEEMIEEAGKRRQKKIRDSDRLSKAVERNPFEKLLYGVAKMEAWLRKAEFILRRADGEKEGPWQDYIFQKIKEGEDRALTLGEEIRGRLAAAFGRFSAEERRAWHRRLYQVPGLPQKITVEEALMIALNSGNEGNLKTLSKGFSETRGWTGGEVEAVWEWLEPKHVELVQEVWSIINGLWPELKAMHQRVTGQVLHKVDGRVIKTQRHGEIDGQYFPIKLNSDLSKTAAKHQLERIEREKTNLMAAQIYGNPSTRAGATYERTGTGAPPRLDFGVISQHLQEVIHDISYRAALRDAAYLLKDDRVMAALEGVVGEAQARQMIPWLMSIAQPQREYQGEFGKWVGRLRRNTTATMLGLKASVAAVQTLSFSQTIHELKDPRAVVAGIATFIQHPRRTMKWVREMSPAMAQRRKTWNRELADLFKDDSIIPARFGMARDAFFWAIGFMDTLAVMPSWTAAYYHAQQQGKGEKECIDFADGVVRRTQPTASPKDLAMIQRGPETQKIFVMFYTFFSVFHNKFYNAHAEVLDKVHEGKPGEAAFAAFRAYWWLLIAPALMAQMIKDRELPEKPLNWGAKTIISFWMAGLPIARDWFGPLFTMYDFQPSPVFEAWTPIRKARSIAHRWLAGKSVDAKKVAETLIEAGGYILGLPSKQMVKTMHGIMEADADKPLESAEGILFGPRRKK